MTRSTRVQKNPTNCGGGGGGGGRVAAAAAAAAAAVAAAAAAAAVGGREVWGRHYPHPPGLPIRRMYGKVHRGLSDAIGPIPATYAALAGFSIWNLSIYLSIYLSLSVRVDMSVYV
jgi:hypothetical protein